MDEEKIEKFLPIGTVVMLKGGTKPIMITSFCIFPTGKVYDRYGEVNKEGLHSFDYGAVFYPEGYLSSDRTFGFKHNQIAKVLFKGYQTEKHNAYSKGLNEMMVGLNEQFKQSDLEREKCRVHFELPPFDPSKVEG